MLITFVVVIAINLIVASQFEKIAIMKGHQGYYFWCFLFGPAGWAMVIALPDRKTAQGAPIADDALPEL